MTRSRSDRVDGDAVPVDYDTDPGRFAANALSTALFSRNGDIHAEIAERLASRRCSLVLDVGGGTGALARLLMDLSVPTVVADRALHVARAPGAVVRADVLALPFRDNIFDGAAALWMLHHVADPSAALIEVFRVLRPGGVLAVSTSSRRNDPELAWALPRWGRVSSFDAEDAPKLLEDLFRVDEVRVWDAPLVTLPDHHAVAMFLRGRGLSERDAAQRAREVRVPLSLTKRGMVAWAHKPLH